MTKWRSIAARIAGVMGVTALALVPALPAHAATYEPITGSGSTWSQNALDQWRANVKANYGMTVNYSGTGSTAGRQEFILGTVDFAVSEIPFQAKPEDGSVPENPGRGYAYAPIVAGGTSFMYNLKIGGKQVTNLRLSGEVITKIFTGKITNWNDAAIQADNPGLAMPNKKITPVIRSDGSGTTAQFTLWMSKQYPTLWSEFASSMGRGAGLTSQYPLFTGAKGQSGSNGVAGYVSQTYGEGAITYVEYSYALKSGFPVAKVLNSSGYYIEPTAESVAVALLSATINTDSSSTDYLTQILDGVYNSGDARAYPLSSYSYMIVPTEVTGVFTAAKGNTLGTFMSYFLCEGQQQAASLGYSPLPMNLVLAGFDQIKRIPGAESANVDPNNCNNPTFKAGDSASTNQLAKTAPQPAACDKVGPDQCTTGTAGALTSTAITGSGNGGSSSNAVAGGSGSTSASSSAGAGGGTAAATGATDVTAVAAYDENGNVIAGAATAAGGAVFASPFTVGDGGWGWQQSTMLAAVGFLLLAVIAPPTLMRVFRRPGGESKGVTR
ncbi:phosphate ABC transporter substrate-binding protein PstS [Diaminobutyricimonas sp. TR449]|uniref:phosphate ABC transporter substrate-binding protein PstS n=1 Tax=Diaminobutyricimonas sp. TR449 TaxID=2708076 RepID=UPI001AB056A8|nr:phosphate ABC transporter substrate-binding protein PstS [Diaminobutyricimonas sp. TR449]